MKVLVDYDNIPTSIRARGAKYLADRILTAVMTALAQTPSTLDIRLYGGWEKLDILTLNAQKLSAEISGGFPTISMRPTPVRVTMELVHAMEIAPRKLLRNKLRLEPLRSGVRFKKPSDTTCRNSKCPIDVLYDFFKVGHCPISGCAGTVAALADQQQQKLVDTMLVADIIYLASNQTDPIAVVGSDDDMWPGINSALALGKHVVHLETKLWTGTSSYRLMNVGTYSQGAL